MTEEEVTAQLLRLAGAPADPPAERTARVREAVHHEWRADRRQRLVRRNTVVALLGVAASLLVGIWWRPPRPETQPVSDPIAIAQRVQGRPFIVRQPGRLEASKPLTMSSSAYPGDLIQTDETSRAALRATDGSSVRIDTASRIKFVAQDVIEVIAGAAYISTASTSHGFEIRTPRGTVRDLGTQFEVRLIESSLRLRVRSGTVEIGRGPSHTTAEAGTETMVTASGITVRRMPVFGSEWAWTTDVAPPFAIEGRTLRAYLDHLTGEQGWTLQYADASVAETAGRTVLHGSVDALTAEEALGVTLATSGLKYHLRKGELLVSRAADAR